MGSQKTPTKPSEQHLCIWAAFKGELDNVKKLLPSVGLEITDDDGSTPLIAAAWGDQPEIIAYLVQQGAKIDAQNEAHSWTALHAAASKGHIKSVEALLMGVTVDGKVLKANPLLEDKYGLTAADYADNHGFPDIAIRIREVIELDKKQKEAAAAEDESSIRLCSSIGDGGCVIM